MNALKAWLKQQRELNDLTQQQLAHKLGKPLQYIQDVEDGEYRLEIIEFIYYCEALNIDPHQGIRLIDLNAQE
ncbi:helix-turn-helix transcriptional regulator [Acinetobacter baumannii]|uniref:helix-turn-helix transcriptional regulator n=1 Tax=Acinetobacter baumannii TaxID=470 RepID=UPI000A3A4D6E|nr:helix-turn-helix transcriptional regulator [Acinetobacter baumannii]MDC4261929.1 helix-turn-helix transcriptional regulator [Acinetobacter baumannii]MDC4876411.1 helix-turn-helix transcriptional regulator [Acinetobacter baumannii]MDC4885185.1 helix-turn-helix transcriptional regulator [Acinetobacter baumannii]MDC4925687.1 helix-turn-helix transcriptional regulator [Acinetobacter baumannii]MDC4938800.1 helix-turn-helix transcriptional regulator [Acinetobacter baumannii]